MKGGGRQVKDDGLPSYDALAKHCICLVQPLLLFSPPGVAMRAPVAVHLLRGQNQLNYPTEVGYEMRLPPPGEEERVEEGCKGGNRGEGGGGEEGREDEKGSAFTYYFYDLSIYWLGDNLAIVCEIIQHLVEGSPLDLLCSELTCWLRKVKQKLTLLELSEK